MPPSRCLVDMLEGEVTCWIKGVGSERVMAMEVAEVEVMARKAGGHTLLGHIPAGLRQGLATSHIPAPLQGQPSDSLVLPQDRLDVLHDLLVALGLHVHEHLLPGIWSRRGRKRGVGEG